MDLRAIESMANSMFLHLLRVASFMAVVPIFGRQRDSFYLRLVLAVAVGAIFWWTGDQQVPMPGNVLAMAVAAVRESFVGIALGFAVYVISSLLVSSGEIVSTEMGFAMARTMNPESGNDATVVSQLFQAFGFLLMLQLDLHHEVLRILHDTFRAVPVGTTYDIAPLWNGIAVLTTSTIALALQYAFPVLGVMIVLTAGLVLLGRAVPAINLMEFSFGIRILLALLAAAWFLAEGTPFLGRTLAGLLGHVRAMFPV